MINNFKNCYCNMFCNARVYHLTVTNKTNLTIRAIIQYTEGTETITKESPYIYLEDTRNLNFSRDATNICFNILNYSVPGTPFICNREITPRIDTAYEVRDTAQGPMCVQIY